MTILQHAVARDREAFLAGQLPSTVRPEIAVSWRRCAYLDVRIDAMAPRFAPSFDVDAPLIRAARPVLDHVTERLGDLGISFLLTDANARILDRRSHSSGLLGRLDTVSAAEGFVFAEAEVGTNGVGTALELGRTVRVDGHEHYADSLHQFTCVGVPVRGADRRLQGLLDVTCVADHDNALVEYIAEQTAERIEQRLLAQQNGQERALLDHFVAATRRGRTDFFLVSERVLIASPRTAQLLDGSDQALVWEHVSRLLRGPGSEATEIELANGRAAVVRVEALRDGGEQVGAIVEVREPSPPVASDADMGVPLKPLPGVVGTDRGWVRACHEVARAAARHVVMVCGEPGVGKAAVAEAVHRDAGDSGPMVVHEATMMSVDGPAAWLDRLSADLDGEPGTVLVRGVDALAPAGMRALALALHGARARGWRAVMTSADPPPAVPEGSDGSRSLVVPLPPLRNRIDDVPALAGFFAAPRRLSPDLVGLLMRSPWPGNVRAMRTAVERACAVARGAEVHVDALPAEVRSGVFRRRMSRFEHAEIAAIMDAMSEVGGNKKAAAALLGISRSTLYRKLEAAGLDLG
ncbi:sigma-54-dependent Fis family transcriptional regulator [Pseudonocardia sp. WMMC193]|uniref:sigma-54-dependent Fis family transcriptional regulator n=1 Tax=Pseudonocardia sp. WMMC193 TaxID=2911965 RepID=UPI001F01C3E2|nr:helix-turn-helix domain-containing protein [Pseudonocardia sp. WMMC193]MCF7550809.1 GAF domain-containing protein [Pseudonocardia sp. WMMC193]